MQTRTITANLKTLTAEAKRLWTEGESINRLVLSCLDKSLDRAWRLGKVLNQIKGMVGTGNWLLWLEANWPELHERTAQRFMVLDRENPEAQTIEDLSPDSVRKFRLGYVPAKERPELEGDQSFARQPHYLTLVNDWRRLHRRMETGLCDLDPTEARRDLKPVFDWLCGLYGIPVPKTDPEGVPGGGVVKNSHPPGRESPTTPPEGCGSNDLRRCRTRHPGK